MGAAESKFFQFLLTEEERATDDGKGTRVGLPGEREILRKLQTPAAVDVASQPELSFNPNKPMNTSPTHDTPLVYAIRYEHKLFLNECLQRMGDPFATNGVGDTAFHIVCSSSRSSQRTDKKRRELLQMLLDQPVEGASRRDGAKAQLEDVTECSGDYHPSVRLIDKDANTPLHLAARSGLLGCVELLLAYGAPVLVKNSSCKSPCDLASDQGQVVIMKLLESKMVFIASEKSEDKTEDLEFRAKTFSLDNSPEGLVELRKALIQDLQSELKVDPRLLCLAEGAEVRLRASTAEQLLIHYNWSKETVLKHWKGDPIAALTEADLALDENLFTIHDHRPKPTATQLRFECDICSVEYAPAELARGLGCREHRFCQGCFTEYIGHQVGGGNAQRITCPGGKCEHITPSSTVERYMPADVKEKYRRFGLAAFVDAHDKTKWCPRKGCEKVVTYPPPGCVVTLNSAVNVECEEGHTFCWACLKEPGHEPLPCELWKHWQETIDKFHQGEVSLTGSAVAQAEAVRWIANNTKPCPKCSTSIQKTHGCNHMTCTRCRYQFCWVCLDPWKLHSRTTGGYFQCTRVDETMAANRKMDKLKSEATDQADKMTGEIKRQHMAKFEILFRKYQAHLENMALECKLLTSAQGKQQELSKMASVLTSRVSKAARFSGVEVVQRSPQMQQHEPRGEQSASKSPSKDKVGQGSGGSGGGGIVREDRFLFNTYGVLIRSRPVLAASYALSYFLSDKDQEGVLREHQLAQGKLEGAVEELAGLVPEHHLKSSRSHMLEVARSLVRQCQQYIQQFGPPAQRCLDRVTAPPVEEETPSTQEEESEGDRFLGMLMEDPRALHHYLMVRFLMEMEGAGTEDSIVPATRRIDQDEHNDDDSTVLARSEIDQDDDTSDDDSLVLARRRLGRDEH